MQGLSRLPTSTSSFSTACISLRPLYLRVVILIPDLEAQPDHLHPQILVLHYISFPGLPKLLLSATRLVKLYLTRISDSMYFPPEVLVDCPSVLTQARNTLLDLTNSANRF